MFSGGYSSDDDDTMSLSMSKPKASNSSNFEYDISNGNENENEKDSRLKQSIRENEDSIIQIILSPRRQNFFGKKVKIENYSFNTDQRNRKLSDKTSSTSAAACGGLSTILDYLFEDGHLTRIEYDIVDKGCGTDSLEEQVKVLLKILVESKDNLALEVLLESLQRLEPTSDVINGLCSNFLLRERKLITGLAFHTKKSKASPTVTVNSSFFNKTAYRRNRKSNKNVPVWFDLGLNLENSKGSRQFHDFYYGRNRSKKLCYTGSNEKTCIDHNNELTKAPPFPIERKFASQKINATEATTIKDFRDFVLTSGCLEIVRNFILNFCDKSMDAMRWENVIRNMNGLLSTDVLSIKDLLHQIRTSDHQILLQEEFRMEMLVNEISRERRNFLRKTAENKKQRRKAGNSDVSENEGNRKHNNKIGNEENARKGSEFKKGRNVNWNQVVYHSLQLQVWKQRCGTYATFYSLVGVFQQSCLNQIADLLMANKSEIQSRASEKDIPEHNVMYNNTNNETKPSTMLEKSAFLRKFYTPSRSENQVDLKTLGLKATKDRVSMSPVLSLDL